MTSETHSRFKRWSWRPPRAHGEVIADRQVSVLELFYDLVYVTVIGQAAHHLDHVALPVAHQIDPRWAAPAWSLPGPGGLLVGPLGDGVGDPPLAQQSPIDAVAGAAVGDQMRRAFARPPCPAWAGDSDGVQERLQLGALVALAGGDQHPQRPPAAIAGEMQLGREPASATAQYLVNLTTRS